MVVISASINGGPPKRQLTGARAGITLSLPCGRLGSNVTPNVGQRGGLPSRRSNESIGKFDSMPPSTSVEVKPLALVNLVVRKKNGIDIEVRTASATSCSSG